MSLQDQFVLCARSMVPTITDTEIAKRIGVARPCVAQRRFGVRKAVDRWNEGKNPPMRFTPASVGPWGAGVAAK